MTPAPDGLTPAEAEALANTLKYARALAGNAAGIEAKLATPDGREELEAMQRRCRAIATSMFMTARELNKAADAIERGKRGGRRWALRA